MFWPFDKHEKYEKILNFMFFHSFFYEFHVHTRFEYKQKNVQVNIYLLHIEQTMKKKRRKKRFKLALMLNWMSEVF